MKTFNSKSGRVGGRAILIAAVFGSLSLLGLTGCETSPYVSPYSPAAEQEEVTADGRDTFSCEPGYYRDLGTGMCVPYDTGEPDGSSSGPRYKDLASAKQVVTGRAHTCVLTKTDLVYCTGDNSRGQLGPNVTEASSATAVTVTGITSVKALAAGRDHTCALLSNSTVYCWGANEKGQLGIDSTTDTATPGKVTTITNALAISAGDAHTCALRSNYRVTCWGSNQYGQLGSGSNDAYVQKPSSTVYLNGQGGYLGNISVLSTGRHHTCVLAVGALYCAGRNNYYQLGNSSVTTSNVAMKIGTYGSIGNKASALWSGLDHSCLKAENGDYRCWGRNHVEQLGGATSASRDATPRTVLDSTDGVAAFYSGGNQNCISAGLQLKCWGEVIGSGGTQGEDTPTAVNGVTGAPVTVSMGESHACAITTDDKVRCWGDNASGQLGNPEVTSVTAEAVVVRIAY